MLVPAAPPNEADRIAVLHSLGILDSGPEERFDRVTRLAQQLFRVPIALITLIDAARQWFKSRQGLEVDSTPRDVSFCGHAILSDRILVVPDARADSRFSDNPLVQGPPGIRFYAGRPLAGPDGMRLGALCILDRTPRRFTEEDERILNDLGALAESELRSAEMLRALKLFHEQERRLRDFMENANDLIQSVGPDGRIRFANRKWRELLGYADHEIGNLNIFDLVDPEYRAHCEAMFRRVVQGESLSDVETVLVARDGRRLELSGSVNGQFENDRLVATRGIFRDVTDQKKAERELRAFNAILSHALEGISRLDAAGSYVTVNPAYANIAGYRPEELIGRPWQQTVDPDDLERMQEAYGQMISTGRVEIDARGRRKDGSEFFKQLVMVADRDAEGTFQGHYCFMKDITERIQAEREVRRLSTVDPLTSLYNRRFLTERADEELARSRRYGTTVSTVMIDLDRFKEINDRYGHDRGDAVLVEVAQVIRQRLRACDIGARFGGDEIILLLPETSLEKACALADDLRRRIAEIALPSSGGDVIRVTCSVGVSELDATTRDLQGLLSRADRALYAAKAGGRNRVEL